MLTCCSLLPSLNPSVPSMCLTVCSWSNINLHTCFAPNPNLDPSLPSFYPQLPPFLVTPLLLPPCPLSYPYAV